VVHPAWFVNEAYDRAREIKKMAYLPFDQLGLYAEPGLTVSLRHATDFFVEHLGDSLEDTQQREAKIPSRKL
jgi:hypothetical protein